MLRISKLTDYSMVILHQLALQADSQHSTTALASRVNEGLPLEKQVGLPTISKVLKILQEAGLVQSIRGVNGGYKLARPAKDISLTEIIHAMEGSVGLTECSIQAGRCNQEAVCTIRSNWQLISIAIERLLQTITLADMTDPLVKHRLFANGHFFKMIQKGDHDEQEHRSTR